ncbi:hypothetical protein BSL78_04472, partial [Apostichopus japonicus]
MLDSLNWRFSEMETNKLLVVQNVFFSRENTPQVATDWLVEESTPTAPTPETEAAPAKETLSAASDLLEDEYTAFLREQGCTGSTYSRWTDYDAVGDVIPGTRFIAFKVPLRLQYFHRKGLEREIFTTSDLNEKLGDKLRLVVDLSCKQVGMYYNPEDLEKNGIRYEKLRVEGKKVPSEHIIKRFKRIVTEFEKRQPEDYYIGVHCTHGVNRTGYVICRYMIEQLSKTTDEALRAFKAGRGYPLERENYIEALHKFEKDACVVKDRNTGHSKGYGFVDFARES